MKKEEEISLNRQQSEAVEHSKGPLLVIAGAGTGKTRVITERIRYLILKKGVKPSQILALTFTEKAASEMEERVDKILPIGYVETWILTFHSFCERVLREEAIHIGLDPAYRILTEAESYLLVKQNLPRFKLKYFMPLSNPTKFIGGMLTHFNRLRDEDILPQTYNKFVEGARRKAQSSKLGDGEIEKLEELAKAYEVYENLKVEKSVMDYADLIANTLKLFRKRRSVLRKYQEKFKYILVDEFQDTNYAQNQLALLLASDDQNITVVADDDQSIYRWRGAAVYNILDFGKQYPKAKKITLTKNYRSSQQILDHAYSLIKHNNPNRLEVKIGIDKRLQAQRDIAGDISLIHTPRVEDEAEAVVKEIKHLIGEEVCSFKDIAILVRANRHSEPFVRSLARHEIPYQFLGPGQLFHQGEVKDLIAYLKVLDNFEDNPSLYRLLNADFINFNSRDIATVVNFSRKNNLSLFESLENIQNIPKISEDTCKKAKKFVDMFNRHLKLLPRQSVGQILYYFVKDVGLIKRLKQPKDSREEKKVQNIARFFDKLKSFEINNEEYTVSAFLEYLELLLTTGESPLAADLDFSEADAINILTVHSAKGLEFPVVFMVNLVSLRFPTVNRREQIPIPEELIKEPTPPSDIHIEEERRLFYVGMTRAMDKLYFTAADYYGDAKRAKKISPFAKEALGENLERYLVKDKVEGKSLFDWVEESSEGEQVTNRARLGRQKIARLSYSQLNTFKVCPLQYKFKYILKIPTPMGPAAAYGNSMHLTLREFYRGLKRGENWGLDDLLTLFNKNWIGEGYGSKEVEKLRKNQGREALIVYYKKHHDPKNLPKSIEHPFKIKVADLWITGYIDRIDELDDGKIEVIDYKTGKSPDEKALQKDLQLTVYSMAVASPQFLNKNLEDVRLSFYHFEDHKKHSTKRTEEDIYKAYKLIQKTAEEINRSAFEPRLSLLCEYCDFQMLCDAYQGSLKTK